MTARRLLVESLYGMQSRRSLVSIKNLAADAPEASSPEWEIMMSPTEARAHAYAILAAAEAAEMDEVVITFLTEQVKLDLARAVLVLRDFRSLRDRVSLEREL